MNKFRQNKKKTGPKGPIKWTEDKAMEIIDGLIEWMLKDDKNIVWERYTVIEKQLYPDILTYLADRYPEFQKKLELARKIQEIRLVEGGLQRDLDKTVSIFLLKCKYGYVDTSRVINDVNINPDDIPLFPDEDA